MAYQYQPDCDSKDDCAAGIRMICEHNKCTCRHGELFLEAPKFGCFVKAHMFERCEVSSQCMALNPNTYCNPENGRCTCSPNYVFNGHECRFIYDTANLKAQEVYKAAVVAAACFIVAVVGIFVACIVRRSFCRREQLQQSESNRNGDIFSISDEIAALRAVDKPPSYEEVLQIERTFFGIPPPEYSGPRDEAPPSSSSASLTISSTLPDISPSGQVEFQPTAEASSSQNIYFIENLTAVASTSNSSGNVNDVLQTTSVDVLPVPSDRDIIASLVEENPSQSNRLVGHSSTPPASPHIQQFLKTENISSSLPSSPYLSSISAKADATFRNLRDTFGRELPVESGTTQHISENSLLSSSDTCSNLSMPLAQDNSTNNTSDCEHPVTVIAYDNLGFEADLYF